MRFLLFLLLFVPRSMLAQKKLPAVFIKTIAGKEANTESFQNGDVPLVISFWAIWCKPCLQELDAFNDLTETWKKETPARIIAISIDDSRTAAGIKKTV
jgi:peroxiredoxin